MTSQLVALLQPNEREAIESFAQRLRAQYASRVYHALLFGSKARGDSRPESDIDVLLIVDQVNWQFRHIISNIAADVSLEHNVLIGPRVIGQERWRRMQREGFGLYRNVEREGIPLQFEF